MKPKSKPTPKFPDEFERWWFDYGSGITPKPGEDTEEFAHRICRATWAAAIVSAYIAVCKTFVSKS